MTVLSILKAAGTHLGAVTTRMDPLGLVQTVGGTPTINTSHKALVSIRDFINHSGSVEGRRLLDKFSEAPFGWSQDTLRYVCAAMLVAGEIKLKVSGREVTAAGQHAIEALKTNNSFKPIGVSLRDEHPPIEMLARATENARQRAENMAKATGNRIGFMRSAKMGVFQITPVTSTDVSDWGVNDTTSFDKKVMAVVTVSFAIE